MPKVLRYIGAAIATSLLCLSAHAGVITTGLTGTFISENFDANSGHNSAAASQFNFLTFGDGNFVSNQYHGLPGMTNSVIANFSDAGCCASPTSFSFAANVSDVAFAFFTTPGESTFTALLNGNVVEKFTAETGAGGMFGFTGIVFDAIRLEAGGEGAAYLLDNLQYRVAPAAAVPEPGSLALLGLGLAGAALLRRRRK